MQPARFPDKDDVVSDIFEALGNGSLQREDVQNHVRQFVTAHIACSLQPCEIRWLVSLDARLFEAVSTTLGDTVTRGF
jgi:hypothetical protein